MTKQKRTNNDLQNTTQKTKDRATQTPLNTGVKSGTPDIVLVPAPHATPVVLLLNDTNIFRYGNRV